MLYISSEGSLRFVQQTAFTIFAKKLHFCLKPYPRYFSLITVAFWHTVDILWCGFSSVLTSYLPPTGAIVCRACDVLDQCTFSPVSTTIFYSFLSDNWSLFCLPHKITYWFDTVFCRATLSRQFLGDPTVCTGKSKHLVIILHLYNLIFNSLAGSLLSMCHAPPLRPCILSFAQIVPLRIKLC